MSMPYVVLQEPPNATGETNGDVVHPGSAQLRPEDGIIAYPFLEVPDLPHLCLCPRPRAEFHHKALHL